MLEIRELVIKAEVSQVRKLPNESKENKQANHVAEKKFKLWLEKSMRR